MARNPADELEEIEQQKRRDAIVGKMKNDQRNYWRRRYAGQIIAADRFLPVQQAVDIAERLLNELEKYEE
jgi:hypothetical protein